MSDFASRFTALAHQFCFAQAVYYAEVLASLSEPVLGVCSHCCIVSKQHYPNDK